MSLKKIDIISASVPPNTCGISDYNVRLVELLKPFASIRLLSGQTNFDPIPDVQIEAVFSRDNKGSIWNVAKFLDAQLPDWLVIQYSPDTMVNRGLLPLASMLKKVRRAHPDLKVAVMVHEWNCVDKDVKGRIKNALLRNQLRSVGGNVDCLFFAVESWAEQMQHWFPNLRCEFMPVGSSVPRLGCPRNEAKKRLGFENDTFIIGLFGRLNETCDLKWCVQAIKKIAEVKPQTAVVYIGIFGKYLKEALEDCVPLVEAAVPSEEVSLRMSAMDLFLLPDREGVTARRTRLMSSLQHSVATLTTISSNTDTVLANSNGESLKLVSSDDIDEFVREAVHLATDDAERHHLETNAALLFENNFSDQHIQSLWIRALQLCDT